MKASEIKYGKLMNYTTGEYIRPATLSELRQSLEAAASTCDETGAFRLDGQSVYVEGESNEAHKMAGGISNFSGLRSES